LIFKTFLSDSSGDMEIGARAWDGGTRRTRPNRFSC